MCQHGLEPGVLISRRVGYFQDIDEMPLEEQTKKFRKVMDELTAHHDKDVWARHD